MIDLLRKTGLRNVLHHGPETRAIVWDWLDRSLNFHEPGALQLIGFTAEDLAAPICSGVRSLGFSAEIYDHTSPAEGGLPDLAILKTDPRDPSPELLHHLQKTALLVIGSRGVVTESACGVVLL